jgi:phosphoglycerate dehydrogenase-like enzyme
MATIKPFPSRTELTICFGHSAYAMAVTFARHASDIRHFQAWTLAELEQRIGQADVLVISGMWHNGLIPQAANLRYLQSISAGMDRYDLAALQARGVMVASAAGVNSYAVAEHALAHMLAFARHIHTGRDNQQRRFWRDMLGDPAQRETELGDKTLLIVGYGRIGQRLAHLASAFDMQVLATKRNVSGVGGTAVALYTPDQLLQLLPRADFVVLTCPLTPETEKLIDSRAFSLMKPSAILINMARGRVVDEPALIAALQNGEIAGAGLDCLWDEPLPPHSPLWPMENVLITPHTGGETEQYEERVVAILLENLERLWRGEKLLINQLL